MKRSALIWWVVGVLLPSATWAIRPLKPPPVKPDWSVYLKKDELLARVKSTVERNPSIMRLETLSAEDAGYSADLMLVSVEPGGLNRAHAERLRVLVDFGEHGREFISSEMGLRFLETLADPAGVASIVGHGDAGVLRRLQHILHRTSFKILPMENPRGRELVERGNLCERKNGRGVDPNRNWGVHWGFKEKDYDPKEEHPGKAPFR